MPDNDSLERAIHEEVVLVPYNLEWPAIFSLECERLLSLFPSQLIEVQHFGSTAIPNMPAKPIIDLLGGVKSMNVADSLVQPLLNKGYTTSAEFNATLTNRRWFMRWLNGHRTHHLHLVVFGGSEWHRRLRFRDILRSDVRLAQQYAVLKENLADQHGSDRETYTHAKSDFVHAVVGGA